MELGQILGIVGGSIAVATVAVKITGWVFRASVASALKPLTDLVTAFEQRLFIVETRQGLLWSVGEQRAMELIHHTDQPFFDYLIDQYQAHTLTDQELDQFISRLEVLSEDESKVLTQGPPAKLLLNSAMNERLTRTGLPRLPTNKSDQQTTDENTRASQTMALESSREGSESSKEVKEESSKDK
jgi:hypothetical protein